MLARTIAVAVLLGSSFAYAQSPSALGLSGSAAGQQTGDDSGATNGGGQTSGHLPEGKGHGVAQGVLPEALSGGAPDNTSSTAHAGGSTTGDTGGLNSFQGPGGSEESHGPTGANKGPAR